MVESYICLYFTVYYVLFIGVKSSKHPRLHYDESVSLRWNYSKHNWDIHLFIRLPLLTCVNCNLPKVYSLSQGLVVLTLKLYNTLEQVDYWGRAIDLASFCNMYIEENNTLLNEASHTTVFKLAIFITIWMCRRNQQTRVPVNISSTFRKHHIYMNSQYTLKNK